VPVLCLTALNSLQESQSPQKCDSVKTLEMQGQQSMQYLQNIFTRTHNPKVVGSNPAPATTSKENSDSYGSSRFVVGTARRWAQAVAFRYFNRYILKLFRFFTVRGGYCPEMGSGRSIQVLQSIHFKALHAVTPLLD